MHKYEIFYDFNGSARNAVGEHPNRTDSAAEIMLFRLEHKPHHDAIKEIEAHAPEKNAEYQLAEAGYTNVQVNWLD